MFIQLNLIEKQNRTMSEVYQKKNKTELIDPLQNELFCSAIFNSSIDASYVKKCIKNLAKRSDERTLTKFITYAQEGMWMLITFK